MNADTNKDNSALNILIGISGSVASIKLEELVNGIINKHSNLNLKSKLNICIIPTQNSKKFIENFDNKFNKHLPSLADRLNHLKQNSNTETLDTTPVVFSFSDEDEWSSWKKRSDPVLHIELRKWADILLIAPLDANTLAKLSNGICDNLLTCVNRAWDLENISSKPIIICPAMNTFMYKHPLTSQQLNLLVNQFGYTLVDSVEKLLMCGDRGTGAMAPVDDILNTLFKSLGLV